MSLIPMLYSDWWEDLDRPHSVRDQYFGMPIDTDDIINRASMISNHHHHHHNRHADNLGYPFFRRMRRRHHPFHHALARRYSPSKTTNTMTTIGQQYDRDNKFSVTIDVQQFAPDEINVKIVDKSVLVVEARHEEKEDEHGWISREFTRKYNVPAYYDVEQIETFLSSDGVLTIQAPRRKNPNECNEKILKIQFTGEPAINDRHDAPIKVAERQNEELRDTQQLQQHSSLHMMRQQMAPQQRGKKK